MNSVVVDFATEGEAAACVAILPPAGSEVRDLMIARLGDAFAGATAIVWANDGAPPGFAVEMTVLPEVRRKGVGRAMLHAVARATHGETKALWAARSHVPGGEASRFLEGCGFALVDSVATFGAPLAPIHARTAALCAKLQSRDAGARLRVAPLDDAHLEPLSWLIAREIGGSPVGIARRLQPAVEDPDGDIGVLIGLDGPDLAGAITWTTHGEVARIDTRVVAAPWRRGPLNLMLLNTALEVGFRRGVTRTQFESRSDNHDTLTLARWGGAQEIDRRGRYRLDFPDRMG